MGERLLCKQEVGGSTPPGSTKIVDVVSDWFRCSISLFNKLDIESDKGARQNVTMFCLWVIYLITGVT